MRLPILVADVTNWYQHMSNHTQLKVRNVTRRKFDKMRRATRLPYVELIDMAADALATKINHTPQSAPARNQFRGEICNRT